MPVFSELSAFTVFLGIAAIGFIFLLISLIFGAILQPLYTLLTGHPFLGI